eukprot:395298_1
MSFSPEQTETKEVSIEEKQPAVCTSFWVGTWNIHSWTDSHNKPNIYRIINALNEQQVDILGLQEVRDKTLKNYTYDKPFAFNMKTFKDTSQTTLDTLKLKTNYLKYSSSISNDINYECNANKGYKYQKHKKKQKTFFGVATVSKYEIINTIYYNSCLQLNIIKLASKQIIGVIVVHFNFRNENKRIDEYNQMLQFTKKYQFKLPLILLGDFNALNRFDYTYNEWKHIEQIRNENN